VETTIAGLQDGWKKACAMCRNGGRNRVSGSSSSTGKSPYRVEHMLNELRASYTTFPRWLKYFDIVQQDMVENVDDFASGRRPPASPA